MRVLQEGSRLIPAHAGKTLRSGSLLGRTTAHPRSRGENRSVLEIQLVIWGSSPLTRGKPRRRARCRSGARLIPAHAGKTAGCAYPLEVLGAHPRSRGENLVEPYWVGTEQGSSPLTRGKPPTPCSALAATGLIPAHAGKTYAAAEYQR